jgi:hypothetical protein
LSLVFKYEYKVVAPHANAFSSSIADKRQTSKVETELEQCLAIQMTANRLTITQNDENKTKTTIMALLQLSLYRSVELVVSVDMRK